jgi:hypothetical protein
MNAFQEGERRMDGWGQVWIAVEPTSHGFVKVRSEANPKDVKDVDRRKWFESYTPVRTKQAELEI